MTTTEVLLKLASHEISQTEAKRLLALPEDQRVIKSKSKGGRPKGSGDDYNRQRKTEKRFRAVLDEVQLWAQSVEGANKDLLLAVLLKDWGEDFAISARTRKFRDPETGRRRSGFVADYDPVCRAEIGLVHADKVQDSRLRAGPRDEFDDEGTCPSFTASVEPVYGPLRRTANEITQVKGNPVGVAMSWFDARRFYPTVEEVAIRQ